MMRYGGATFKKRGLVLPLAVTLGLAGPAQALTFSDLYKSSVDQINRQIYKAIGSLRICAANEVKPWLVNDVMPAFRETEKAVVIGEGDLVFDGSGELADHWNNGNTDKCDVIVLGSDVSALRAADFERTKAVSLAYTPTLFVASRRSSRLRASS